MKLREAKRASDSEVNGETEVERAGGAKFKVLIKRWKLTRKK